MEAKIKRTLISCCIFQDKMEYLLKENKKYEVDIIWLDAYLHGDLNKLEKKLKEVIFENRENKSSGLRIMYGQFCLPEMPNLAKEQNIKLLSTKNCLSSMIGEKKLLELEKNRTMVITPSWIRKMWSGETGLAETLGWTEVDFRLNFGRYDKVLVLETGIKPLSDEEILTFFDLIEVPIESYPCSLKYFEDIFYSLLE